MAPDRAILTMANQ